MEGAAPHQPNPAGNNETVGSSKTPAQAMADLAAQTDKLMAIVVTAENQETINSELAKLREDMAKIQRDIEEEAARMARQQALIPAEMERLNTQGWRLERQQRASDAIHQRRHHGRLPADLNPTRLFDNPHTLGVEPNRTWQAAPGGEPARPLPQPTETHATRFHTPRGHFSNPVENMLAATRHLKSLPVHGNSPAKVEVRNTIEMLKMVVVQQAQYSYSRERLHSTPQASHIRSRHDDLPAVNSEHRCLPQTNPPDTRARDLMDLARTTRQVEAAAAAGQGYPIYAIPSPATTETGGRHIGVPCLAPAIRNECMPKDFKGPRKVPNYTPDLEPRAWIESYELAMDMLDVSEAACAKYFTMMLEGTTRTWLKSLPPNSINTWAKLKERFIKNFRGTCKRLMTIVDLQHCVQRPDESTHRWTRRVAEDMGELMDTLTRYAEANDTKDPGEDDDKINTANRGELPRGFSEKNLMPSSTVFHGIVPGKSGYPVRRIKLNVAFGTKSNYMSESLIFEVVKITSPYHALCGRPAYDRFRARPCYVYLKLKMPGPKGTITVNGDRRIAQECEEGDAACAESACAAEELKFHQANVDPADMTPLKKPTIDSEPPLKLKPKDDTKVVDFTPGDSSKQFTIGPGLDPK
ncbi:hypothetical protein ZWY2020_048915 [Hordeum vulgare]|nr:hypothetical protein ZWY2020_048915 [Hordeum vulgare]